MNYIDPLPKLEEIAQIACFSLDYQKKNQAERYFLEFNKKNSTGIVVDVLKYGSDTLIFVVIQYANKLIEEYTLEFLKELFNAVEGEVAKWYVCQAHQFRRSTAQMLNGVKQIQVKQITKYVMNSISLFMSNCMKRFYLQETSEKRNQIVEWISNVKNERYKLWLFTIFIQNISQIDQSMGFIKFRSLSYNFQEEVIPLISKCIIPFLYKVEDIMKINEISELQENLNVKQQPGQNGLALKSQKIFQNENEFKFAQLVFQLLHNLVFYNFHLTYTEYEQEATFQNCLICFPEQFTAKVVTEEFISSMGYVIMRLIDLMPRSNFLKTTLECLQKIFLTKLSYVDEQKKINFIRQCTIMLTLCLNKQNLNQYILTKLMVCNNKFLNNIDIAYLKDKPQLKQAFHGWLQTVTKTTCLVLDKISLAEQFNFNLEESLVIQCLQLYQKIVGSLCSVSYIAFQEIEPLDSAQQRMYIQQNVQYITSTIIKKLLIEQSQPLIVDSTAQIFKSNILEIKNFCSCFFQPFKQLASLNYDFLFTQLLDKMDVALTSQSASVKFNLFILLCELMDRNFLERNIVSVKASEEEVLILSKCVNKGLKFLQTYLKTKQQLGLNEEIILMDISILLFFDKVLSEFLGYFQNHETTIQIKQKIFLNILKIQNKSAFIANASEQFILFCVESVLSFLLIYNKTQQSSHIIQFIFETINRILMKFKWGIKRDVFKASHIYAKLELFFAQVEKQTNIKPSIGLSFDQNLALFHQFQKLKWRKKLLKVIALLYFDDIIDDYRRNLENIFTSLKNEHILTILLDIEGIGEAIDTTSIYKTFLEMIEKYFNVEALTKQLARFAFTFNAFDTVTQKYPRVKIIKQVLKMHKAVLSNKGQRIGNPKNMQSVYMMIKGLIKYWIDFLRMSQSQEWVPVITQVVNIIAQLIKCDKINFYLIQRVCLNDYVEFFNELFGKMLKMSQKIEQFPKFYESYLTALVNISRQLTQVIFFPSIKIKSFENKEKNKQISQSFLRLFLFVFKKVPTFLQQFKVSNTKNELYLQKSIEIVKFTLAFIDCKTKQQITHKEEMQQINLFVDEMKPLIFEYSNQLLGYLTTEKHFSVHRRTLIILLYEATIIYPELMQMLINELKLPNYLLMEAKECLQYIKKQQQQLFIDRFKTWLRMIHMTEEEITKNKEQQRDFYSVMGIL